MAVQNGQKKPETKQKWAFLDTHRIISELTQEGKEPLYIRKALYPLLEVNVVFRERSKEEMGEIERTMLRLVGQGIGSPESLAQLTGFSLHRLRLVLDELLGRGLLDYSAPQFLCLSELGKRSVEYGVEIVETERALLLCGLTGRLMPKNVYDEPAIQPDDLRRYARSRDLIDPSDSISLRYIDLGAIENKREVNIVDEAIEIVGFGEKRARFVEGILVCYRKNRGETGVELRFRRTKIDWIPADRALPLIEPLGFSRGMEPNQVFAEIENELKEIGCRALGIVTKDNIGTPLVRLDDMEPAAWRLRYEDKPLACFIATDTHPFVPIGAFPPGRGDLLFGRCLNIYAHGSDLKWRIDILRMLETTVSNFYKTPTKERKIPIETLVATALEDKSLSVEEAYAAVEPTGYRKLINILETIQGQ